jgi:DeoR/GlpR family transcriptional regulator of sugar metabolism
MAAVGGSDAPQLELIGLGGGVRKPTRSFVGAETVRAIRNVFADRLVFSVKGIETGGVLTDPDPREAEVKRSMIGLPAPSYSSRRPRSSTSAART